MNKPFGSNVVSALAQRDFLNVASDAFDRGQTLPQMLIDACVRHANRPAATNLGCSLSFADVHRQSAELVVARKDPALGEGELRAHCRKNLTGYKQPKVIEFRQSLPKSAVGKILRRELRQPAAN